MDNSKQVTDALALPCIQYTGHITCKGYPRQKVAGKQHFVHRLIAALTHNRAYSDHSWQTRHLCGNTQCVRVEHLATGTAAENAADRALHGVSSVGEANPAAKLTAARVRAIRHSTAPLHVLAKQYDVSSSAISAVRLRKTWTHLPESETERQCRATASARIPHSYARTGQ